MTLRDVVRQARALLFDFDGTLVDSNRIKEEGFESVFSEFPKQREAILAHCRERVSAPRWEKFRWVVERILQAPYTPEVERALSERYERLTTYRIVAAPEVPGARRFLE